MLLIIMIGHLDLYQKKKVNLLLVIFHIIMKRTKNILIIIHIQNSNLVRVVTIPIPGRFILAEYIS
jgi:hypothetical protein